MSYMTGKPTIKTLREETPFTRMSLSRYVRLSDATVEKMEKHIPVSRESAQRVLDALNTILHTTYVLENIDIALTDQEATNLP